MIRLYLTDEQAECVTVALNNQIRRLHICAEEMHETDVKQYFIDEANTLKDVVDVLDYSTRK